MHGPGAARIVGDLDLVTGDTIARVGRGCPPEVDPVAAVSSCRETGGRTRQVRVRGRMRDVGFRPRTVGVDRGYPVVPGCALRETVILVVGVVVTGVAHQRPPGVAAVAGILNEVARDAAGSGGRRIPFEVDFGSSIGGGRQVSGSAGYKAAGPGIVGDTEVVERGSLVARGILEEAPGSFVVVNPYVAVIRFDRVSKRQGHLVAADTDSDDVVIVATHRDIEPNRSRHLAFVKILVIGQDELDTVHFGVFQHRCFRVDLKGLALRGVTLVYRVGPDPDRQEPVVVVIGLDIEFVLTARLARHFLKAVGNGRTISDFDTAEIEAGDSPREQDPDRELTVRRKVLVRGDRPHTRHAGGSTTAGNVPITPPLHTHRPLTTPILEGRLLRLCAGLGKKDHTRHDPRHPCSHLAPPPGDPGDTASGSPGCRGRAARARSSDAAADLTRTT